MARREATGIRRWAATAGAVCVLFGAIACTSDETGQRPSDAGEESADKERDGSTRTPEQTDPGRSDRPTPGDDRPTRGDGGDVPEKYDALLRKAAEEGSVRVIVTMRLESTPQRDPAYRKAVADAADEIFAELRRFGVQRGHTYRNFPMLTAEVNEEALRHLVRSDRVVQVSEDEVDRAQ